MMFYLCLQLHLLYSGGVNKGDRSFLTDNYASASAVSCNYCCFSLTIKHTGADGVTRTGLEGFKGLCSPQL